MRPLARSLFESVPCGTSIGVTMASGCDLRTARRMASNNGVRLDHDVTECEVFARVFGAGLRQRSPKRAERVVGTWSPVGERRVQDVFGPVQRNVQPERITYRHIGIDELSARWSVGDVYHEGGPGLNPTKAEIERWSLTSDPDSLAVMRGIVTSLHRKAIARSS